MSKVYFRKDHDFSYLEGFLPHGMKPDELNKYWIDPETVEGMASLVIKAMSDSAPAIYRSHMIPQCYTTRRWQNGRYSAELAVRVNDNLGNEIGRVRIWPTKTGVKKRISKKTSPEITDLLNSLMTDLEKTANQERALEALKMLSH
ncbi:MAG: hypothetical protein V1900_03415 [Candidatus Aenigmatarchaeota archaeon]